MSETAAILGEMVERLLGDHVDPKLLSAVEGGEWPHDLWRVIEQQGLPAALLPEARGGMGVSFRDAFVIARACGRHRAPAPLPETMAAGWLLAAAGLDVPEGPLALAAGVGEAVRLEGSGGDLRLTGSLSRVPWARFAHSVVFAMAHGGTTWIVRAPRQGCVIETAANIAGEFRDGVSFRNLAVDAAPWRQGFGADPALVVGAMMRGAQIAGALADVLERSVTHANDRRQFGRPVGKQQAVQQNLAVLAAETAAVGVAAEAAFIAADGEDAEFLVAVAKVRVGLAAPQAIAIAHQVHGAIGFTMEHPLQWSTRRLMAWRTEYGSDRHWSAALGRRMVGCGPDGFWPLVTAR